MMEQGYMAGAAAAANTAAGPGRRVMAARLGAGLAQGLLLYWLYNASNGAAWPATAPYVMVPLMMALLIAPVLLVSSLGHLAPRQAARWLLAALAVLLLLSLHDVWRGQNAQPLLPNWNHAPVYSPSTLLVLFGGVFFFIAHSLVMAGAQEGRRIAGYGAYFEAAWKLAIQLLFSAFFVGALFLVLFMGGELFMLIRLGFLRHLLRESAFNVPVICGAFSCAMHVTDVRPAIVRGIRTLLLVLMSWILPVAVVIVAGFLCSLPFTGLDALWETRHATSVLLAAAAMLVVLINAAFQNGEAAPGTAGEVGAAGVAGTAAIVHGASAVAGVPAAVRLCARAAAVVILPTVAIGVYALGLRVLQYGWTSDRVIAAACLLVAGCYGAGYAWAAYRYDTWLRPVATVNVIAAFVVLAVLLALFTPVADPARIAVDSQMARLASGRAKADEFDFRYLRFEGGRYGRAALEQLGRRGYAAATAALALADKDRWSRRAVAAPVSVADNLTVWPAGTPLPPSFAAQDWTAVDEQEKPACMSARGRKCDVFLIDLTGDGRPDLLLLETANACSPGGGPVNIGGAVMSEAADGRWGLAGKVDYRGVCDQLLARLKAGAYKVVAPRLRELEIDGLRIGFRAWQARKDRQ